jgi:hypothetical protein
VIERPAGPNLVEVIQRASCTNPRLTCVQACSSKPRAAACQRRHLPNLLLRLLGLVAQFDEIPYGIALTRHRASLKLSIDLGRLEDARAETLLNNVAGIPTVRGVADARADPQVGLRVNR